MINHIGTLDAGHYTSYIRFMHSHIKHNFSAIAHMSIKHDSPICLFNHRYWLINDCFSLNFRQHGSLWFHCNDHQILPASIDQVPCLSLWILERKTFFHCLANLELVAEHFFRCWTVKATYCSTTSKHLSTANRFKSKTKTKKGDLDVCQQTFNTWAWR